MIRWIVAVLIAAVFGWLALSSVFVVDQTECAVVLRFGQPVRTLAQPGLFFKLPAPVDVAVRLDNRLHILDPRPVELLTKDKKNLIVDSYLVWQIADPLRFLQALGSELAAEARLTDVLWAELGVAFGSSDFTGLIAAEPDAKQLDDLQTTVTAQCENRAGRDFGIHVQTVRIKRLSFPEQNLSSVFDRMRAERARIATAYRSEGEEEAAKIKAQADREARELIAESVEQAEEIKGEGEAQAMRIYAASYGAAPDFYQFLRTLQAYESFLGTRSTLVLPAGAPLFALLNDPAALPVPSTAAEAADETP